MDSAAPRVFADTSNFSSELPLQLNGAEERLPACLDPFEAALPGHRAVFEPFLATDSTQAPEGGGGGGGPELPAKGQLWRRLAAAFRSSALARGLACRTVGHGPTVAKRF